PSRSRKSNSLVSSCSIFQARTCFIFRSLLLVSVKTESLSRSITMSCANPAREIPSASPPQPANNSTLRIEKLSQAVLDLCLSLQFAFTDDKRLPTCNPEIFFDLLV